jgi:uncharacterized delta-60 repeat protein/uncharacterized repeat protein (TIGR01451 family)
MKRKQFVKVIIQNRFVLLLLAILIAVLLTMSGALAQADSPARSPDPLPATTGAGPVVEQSVPPDFQNQPGLAPQALNVGDLDPSFGTDGKVTTDFLGDTDECHDMAIQTDGKIVLVGRSNGSGGDFDFALARYNSDGSLDTSFGSGGKVTTDFGNDEIGYAVAIQSDGKIVAVGSSWWPSSSSWALARYNSNGNLDTSFGSNGKVITDLGSGKDHATDIAIQPDGKIVVTGSREGGSVNSFYAYDIALVCYNSDGSLDTSFGSSGKVIADFGREETGSALAIQADGKIVIAGQSIAYYNHYPLLARYNSNGSLDTSFGSNGKVIDSFGGGYNDVAIQTDGKIVVVGGEADFILVRYNSNGSLDTSFGTDGKVTTDFGDDESGRVIAIQTDGKIVVAGTIGYSGDNSHDFALARHNSSGSLDTSFNIDGKVITDFGSWWDEAHAVAIQTDGRIVVAGKSLGTSSFYDFALARYLACSGTCLSINMTIQLNHIPVQPGDPLTYTVKVGSSGTNDAPGLVISDPLPMYLEGADLYQTVDISAGRNIVFTLPVTVSPSTPLGESIANTAFFSHPSKSGQVTIRFQVGPDYLPLICK